MTRAVGFGCKATKQTENKTLPYLFLGKLKQAVNQYFMHTLSFVTGLNSGPLDLQSDTHILHNDKSNILSENTKASLYYPKQGVDMIILTGFQSKDKTTSDKTTSDCTHVKHLEMYYNC